MSSYKCVLNWFSSRKFIFGSLGFGVSILLGSVGFLQIIATTMPGISDWIAFNVFGTASKLILLISIIALLVGLKIISARLPEWEKYESNTRKIFHWIFMIVFSCSAFLFALVNHTEQAIKMKTQESSTKDAITRLMQEKDKVRDETDELREAIVHICRQLDEPCQNLTFSQGRQSTD